MAKKPRFKVGDKVKSGNFEGDVTKVWTVNPEVYRYTIKIKGGKIIRNEDEVNRA